MKIVYVPLDERPCNYHFAGRIASGSEITLVKPEKNVLGDKKLPADYELLKEFMVENASDADAYIVSLDMLLYGGIVPSRLHGVSEDELCRRLALLDKIKEINPKIRIYAFALIMRCPKYSSSDEEPDYYEYCGREIFLTGQAKHKRELGIITADEADKLISEYKKVIGDNLEDFEARRRVNRNMLIRVAQNLHKSIDFLIIPQDDSAEYGYTSMDREEIKNELKKNGLCDVAMYPGADEVGMTLLARAACDLKGVSPKIYCEFPHKDAPSITPLYEDRQLCKTLPFQIGSAGCVECESKADADIHLYMNYPAFDPVEVWQEKSAGYDARDLDGFISNIQTSIREGRVTAIADGAYCNGGDRELLQMLASKTDLLGLSAYAGWNTSSNTLGTVICQAVFVFLFGDSEDQKKFLAERVYEDVGYCGFVRAYITNNLLADMGYNYFDAGSRDGEVSNLVRTELIRYIKESFPDIYEKYEISVCEMPWRRMFEVDLALEKKK
jgi:hypothetical protein